MHQHGRLAGVLEEIDRQHYRFAHVPDYAGEPGSPTYFIKRFDRPGRQRLAVEDFAQLSGAIRETKTILRWKRLPE